MNCEIQVEQILLEITGVNFEKNSELKTIKFPKKNNRNINR